MKAKRALLVVESQKKAMDRAFNVFSKPTKKYVGMVIISFPDFATLGRISENA